MILVFGGTTEGRRAVGVLEEAGAPYYYSTRGTEQAVEQVHGVRLSGAMDAEATLTFCREHDIRLIVDAAHPFAEVLHRNLAEVAQRAGVPLVRYERIYPPHTPDVHWCRDYEDAMHQMESAGVKRLLALTGVQTIGRLKPFWQRHPTWFRILDRDSSREIAAREGFPEERLVGVADDEADPPPDPSREGEEGVKSEESRFAWSEELKSLSSLEGNSHSSLFTLHSSFPLPPFDAMLTKESGLSGGFMEKVATAKAAGQDVFVVERPPLPFSRPAAGDASHRSNSRLSTLDFQVVNGPHGLRRAVEHFVPEFFPLRSGLTTGTCATAAVVAAVRRALTGGAPAEVPVLLPDGETIDVAVGYADDHAYCIKDAGDDPDVTNGIQVRAALADSSPVAQQGRSVVTVEEGPLTVSVNAGEGIGRFTLPGFDYPPGEVAVNKGPRQMLRDNLSMLANTLLLSADVPLLVGGKKGRSLSVLLSIPEGEALARRTFNPRLGIEGGLSVIGVSGIVKPFSEEAFLESIHKCVTVAAASGAERMVIGSGFKSEGVLRERYPELPQQAFVQYGNYVGATLKMASDAGFRQVTLGVMLGKAVKLAAGQMDTHSRRGTFDRAFLQQLLQEAGSDVDISNVTLVRELWDLLPSDRLSAFVRVVADHCRQHCQPLLPEGELTLLLIDDNGKVWEERSEK